MTAFAVRVAGGSGIGQSAATYRPMIVDLAVLPIPPPRWPTVARVQAPVVRWPARPARMALLTNHRSRLAQRVPVSCARPHNSGDAELQAPVVVVQCSGCGAAGWYCLCRRISTGGDGAVVMVYKATCGRQWRRRGMATTQLVPAERWHGPEHGWCRRRRWHGW